MGSAVTVNQYPSPDAIVDTDLVYMLQGVGTDRDKAATIAELRVGLLTALSITTAMLQDLSVTNAKLAQTAVDTNVMVDLCVTNDKMGAQVVTSDKIADSAKMQLKQKSESTVSSGTSAALSWASGQPVGTLIRVTVTGKLITDGAGVALIEVDDETTTVLVYSNQSTDATADLVHYGSASTIFKVAGNGSIIVKGTFSGGGSAGDMTVTYEVLPDLVEL